MYDIAIIGAGPAGASAALFAAKAKKKTIVFDDNQSITRRAWIENHYGVEKIDGPTLVDTGIRQAKNFGAEFITSKVTKVQKQNDGFTIASENGEYTAKHIIWASGLWTDVAEEIGLQTTPGTEPRIKTVLVTETDGQTNIPGIWAAGTVAGVSVHTIVTAGDGARVAINVISAINGERYVDHDVLKS